MEEIVSEVDSSSQWRRREYIWAVHCTAVSTIFASVSHVKRVSYLLVTCVTLKPLDQLLKRLIPEC